MGYTLIHKIILAKSRIIWRILHKLKFHNFPLNQFHLRKVWIRYLVFDMLYRYIDRKIYINIQLYMYIDIHVYISLQSKTNMSHNSHSIKPGICSHFIEFKGCSVFYKLKIYNCMLLHIRKHYLWNTNEMSFKTSNRNNLFMKQLCAKISCIKSTYINTLMYYELKNNISVSISSS